MTGQNSTETPSAKGAFVEPTNEPSFLGLAAKIFWGSAPARTVAIMSCFPGEGATFVAEALASFLTQGNATVSLISAEEFLSSKLDRSNAEYPEFAASRQGKATVEEIVLVDCPALYLSPAAIRVSPLVDGVLLVIEDGERSKAELQRAVSMIEGAESRVLGAILNKRRYLLPGWLYSLLS
jgi:Mrp family chromosome partitioning ATPase